ncbi:MAG: DUF935 domain-containing protein [Desulfobacterium sp.]|nr:DUF935 domain-containing protein [Desulfobacterium sp.]
MGKILDQFGRPFEAQKKPERRPLAAAPLTDAWREYVASGLTPGRLATLLKEADAGDVRRQAELFDQIEERDGHIIGEIGKRKNVILDVDFAVTPATDDLRDAKIAEEAQLMLDNITDWADVLVSLQDAVGKGFAGLEMDWDASEGQAEVGSLEFIEQKRFLFHDERGILCKHPRLVTDEDSMGMDIPAWKVLFHRYGGKSGHPTRSGIHRICAWWYLFKNYAIKDWVVFCEVYGMPLRLGKYDSGATPEDKDALEIAVRLLGSDAAGIISKSTEIDFITSSQGSVSADLYKDLAGFGNKETSKAILGATLTADVGDKGSYAASNTHNDVRLDLMRADARSVASTVRSQFIRPWVGFNYGWDTPVPKYGGNFKKSEDQEKKSKVVDTLADRIEIPCSWVREEFGIPAPKDGEPCLSPKTPNTGQISTKMDGRRYTVAKNANQPDNEDFDALGGYLGRMEKESDPLIQDLLAPVRKIMDQAESLEEVRDRLVDLYSDMDAGDLGVLIQQAMTAAELMGRYEVENDA